MNSALVNSEMHERIVASLLQVEQEENVQILYTCESGSRAWGFPSRDSDYDVRFVYVRRPEWYLSIDLELKRDVIERPLSEQLDISGWDLRKALQLLRKSNPPLLEWLSSPIIYLNRFCAAEQLRMLAPVYYSPTACWYHYWHMAQGNYKDHLRGDDVWLKKYFYILRPILAIQWIEQGRGVVPIEFGVIVETLMDDKNLRQAIVELLKRKWQGDELDVGPKIPALSEFIESELKRHAGKPSPLPEAKVNADQLNEFFRAILDKVWRSKQEEK